jgi:hypothetical protein
VEEIAIGASTEQVLPMLLDELSAPVVADKTPAPSRIPTLPIPPAPLRGAATGAAVARGSSVVDTTLRTAAPAFEIPPESELSPEIEIVAADGGPAGPRRATRDTASQLLAVDQTRPTLSMELDDQTRPTPGMGDHGRPVPGPSDAGKRASAVSDGIPGPLRSSSSVIPSPVPADPRRLGDRPSTINAATLPPARPISRPPSRPAVAPPQVISRPLSPEDRARRESEGIEVYSPALPSADLPPGERPGQYAQHHKVSTRIPIEGLKQERTGSAPVPIPAGLGRPQRAGSAPSAVKPGTPAAAAPPAVRPPVARESAPRSANHTEPLRGRVPTPARLPVTSRSGSTTGSGVVMTRPAVIVGAPGKTAGTVPRIRKAREDEGRGFGQGLISEKSLDEVILAYLSEDADEK